MRYSRRQLLGGLGAAGTTAAAGCSVPLDDGGDGTDDGGGDGGGGDTGGDGGGNTGGVGPGGAEFELGEGPTVSLEPVAFGLTSPTQFVVEPNTDQRYVVDQTGTIRTIGDWGLHDRPFLDFTDRVEVNTEKGLLGLAFHPNYPDDPRLFLRYSAPRRQGTPQDYSHTEVLAEFDTVSADTPTGRAIDVASERTLIEFPSPEIYHQAGTIIFGPDGYLYVAMGEGTRKELAQDVETNLLGGIHRIDVDSETGDLPYGIPEDNPLVGEAGRDEYYAWGFRNPWRMSFNDGDLIVGDVGEFSYEEVSVVEKGKNYGWPYREGRHCGTYEPVDASAENCGADFSALPGDEFVDPVAEFPHTAGGSPVGFAVIGGYVYDRDDIPAIRGNYVFSNYSRSLEAPAGDLFMATPSDDGEWPLSRLTIANGPDGQVNRVVNSMGRDHEGHLYLLTTQVPDKSNRFAYDGGEVLKVVPEGSATGALPRAGTEAVRDS